MHFRAVKGSRGVGFLVKNILFEWYVVTFVVFTCYLPPEGSPRISVPNSFFSHLLAQMYSLSDVDAVCVCGDFNGRKLNDCITDVDDMLPRNIIDSFVNGYGEALVEFLPLAGGAGAGARVRPKLAQLFMLRLVCVRQGDFAAR